MNKEEEQRPPCVECGHFQIKQQRHIKTTIEEATKRNAPIISHGCPNWATGECDVGHNHFQNGDATGGWGLPCSDFILESIDWSVKCPELFEKEKK
jgi:hypothetical protein